MLFEENHRMDKELSFNYNASFAVDNNIRRNNLGESTLCSHLSSTCSSHHGPLQVCNTGTGNSFNIGSAPPIMSSNNTTHNNDNGSTAASTSIMWNYNPYRRRQSQDAAIHRNKSMPTREPLGSDILPVSITNCSYSENTMSRQQVVVAEDDFRRQVREMSTDSIHIAHPLIPFFLKNF
jgi:hypothetical protein